MLSSKALNRLITWKSLLLSEGKLFTHHPTPQMVVKLSHPLFKFNFEHSVLGRLSTLRDPVVHSQIWDSSWLRFGVLLKGTPPKPNGHWHRAESHFKACLCVPTTLTLTPSVQEEYFWDQWYKTVTGNPSSMNLCSMHGNFLPLATTNLRPVL